MSDSYEYQSPVVKQAKKKIENETDWRELGRELDIEHYTYDDAYPEWHSSTPFRPMVLSTLWALVENESISGIPNRLENNPELVEAFGFTQGDLPDESTFRRTWNNRFEELQSSLERDAEKIQNIAAERGAPIGFQLGKPQSETSTGKESPSRRTINRMLRRKGTKVLHELKNGVIPSMSLPRSEDAVYETDDLLTLESIAAIKESAAHGASEIHGDKKNPDPSRKDPYYEDGPTGETLLEAIKEMSVDEIANVINYGLQKTYTRAKPRLRKLDDYSTSAMVALDITYVAYYGDRDELEWVMGTPKKNEDQKPYDWCHMFATAVIVGENTHYTVAVLPVGSKKYADNDAYAGNKQNSYHVGDVARQLLTRANEFVDIRMVYADREFHSADAIRAIESIGANYIIPAKKDKRIKRLCNRFENLKKGHDEKRDEEVYVKQEYVMRGPVKYNPANTRVESTVVLLPPDSDDETHDEGSPQPFLTNSEVSDEIALDRRETVKKINRYSDRGAIENSYSSIKKCSAWTTSKAFEVRWFHFGFGCIVYNLWLLVDFLTQERLGIIETQMKPRITLKRFLNLIGDNVVTLV